MNAQRASPAFPCLIFQPEPVVDSTLDDLDPLKRDRLRAIIRLQRGEPALLNLSDEELGRVLQLVKNVGGNDVPTITGLLTIGRPEALQRLIPTAGAVFQVLVGRGPRKRVFLQTYSGSVRFHNRIYQGMEFRTGNGDWHDLHVDSRF